MLRRCLVAVLLLSLIAGCVPNMTVPTQTDAAAPTSPPPTDGADLGAVASGVYPDFFAELLGKSQEEVDAKIQAAWQHFFYGDDATQRVYYPVGDDMAYILDVGNADVRSEGMSYGMMIAVQLDKQEEFNRIWTWAKRYMYHQDGPYQGYFAWHALPDGTQLDTNPAPDGEEWFATALYFASGRWGDGEGIYDYRGQADAILHAMRHTRARGGVATDMFHPESNMVVFVPRLGPTNAFTDPSYHLPHFYELWADWAATDNQLWRDAASVSRAFFHDAAHPTTGLMPDYARFDGTPESFGAGGHENFQFDAWRAIMNVAVDHLWYRADPWQVEQTDRVLDFFAAQGLDSYKSVYTLDGTPLVDFQSPGLVAMNAVGALAATHPQRAEFVQALWDLTPPSGQWRYYDGMLYTMALLHGSGNFRVYAPE